MELGLWNGAILANGTCDDNIYTRIKFYDKLMKEAPYPGDKWGNTNKYLENKVGYCAERGIYLWQWMDEMEDPRPEKAFHLELMLSLSLVSQMPR